MAPGPALSVQDKSADYASLRRELAALLAGERDLIANAANTAALIFEALPNINWAGFYFLKDGELVVGPFQGKPACVRIALGRGVCGTAAAERRVHVGRTCMSSPATSPVMPPRVRRSCCP